MSQRLPRRRFFSLSAVTASALVAPLGCGSDGVDSTELSVKFFPQSVASGDPRESSVVLWTRVVDPKHANEDLEVELEISTHRNFVEVIALDGQATSKLTARAEFDHCVSLRVDGLAAATTYYYRFRYEGSEGLVVSRTGRTRTAPAADADVPVKFGVVCCQSYSGRYYHVLRQLATYELDFVLHLGDYVYETGSALPGTRRVVFGKPEEALVRGEGDLAARSLDNYRDLYRLYRSDRDLQGVHELFPMIVIADDHEFSNDCYGGTATYTEGRSDETDEARRAASDQAWFEYMPVDYSEVPASRWQPALGFPDQLKIYRSFGFGKHLELVLTDQRRYRPDHIVPENAFPGAIFATSAEVPDASVEELVPYIDLASAAGSDYKAELVAHATELEIDPNAVGGLVSAGWINEQLASVASTLPPIDLTDLTLPRGYAYHQLLKTAQYSSIGARYVLAEKPFEALAALRYQATNGAAQSMLGVEQRAWFLQTLKQSQRTFKIWGSELAFLARKLDLNGLSQLPPPMQTRIVISADDWDGFPDERRALFEELVALDNVVILSGDLHCFFAGTPFDPAAPERRIVELLTGSVSSNAWLDSIADALRADPSVPPAVANVASAVGAFLQDRMKKPNPHLAFQELSSHGCSVLSVSGTALEAELLFMSPDDVKTPPNKLPGPLAKRFSTERLRVQAGSRTLERSFPDGYYAWDVTSATWVPS
ncbi:MAG: alkaline phosphatase D family protein [Myxococcota bacterium]